MQVIKGGCDCGNISYVAKITSTPSMLGPRLCDCRFCTSHGAAYISDGEGELEVVIRKEHDTSRYRQGSRIADFLLCKTCGVLIGVFYEEGERVYASINARSADDYADFGAGQVVSLTRLGDEERIARWKRAWFRHVTIGHEGGQASR